MEKMKLRNKRNNVHSFFVRIKHSKGILGKSVRTYINIYLLFAKKSVISKDIKAGCKSIPFKKSSLERRISA